MVTELLDECRSVANAEGTLKHEPESKPHGEYLKPTLVYDQGGVRIVAHRWMRTMEVKCDGQLVVSCDENGEHTVHEPLKIGELRKRVEVAYNRTGPTPYRVKKG